MKKIILAALMHFLFFYTGVCQQPPTKAELEKMMKDAKEMLAKLQKQAKDTSSSNTTPKENAVTKSVSAIVSIHLRQPLEVPTEAQANDHLLWYKGKKMNDSMLVTTKGMVVLYSKMRHEVIAQPLMKTDPFRFLVNNLSKAGQMTDDYIKKEAARKNSALNYPLIQMTVDEFQDIDERLNAAIKNTIDLPALSSMKPVSGKSRGGMEPDFAPEEDLTEMHRQLKELLRNEPEMRFEAPPKKNFSLAFLCDKNAQKRYQAERKKWEEEFLQYEDQLIRVAMNIFHYMASEATVAVTSIEPGSTSINEDLKEAFTRSFSRADKKVKLLIGQNGKNIFMQDCVLNSILQNERKKQLLDMGEETGGLDVISQLLEGAEFENYINEEINKKNWDVIFNMSVTFGRNRQTQLMGAGEVAERLSQLTLRILNLNRFALTADLDFNVQITDNSETVLKASGKIYTPDKVYVSLSRSGCKWTLNLFGTDYGNAKEEEYYIPMRVTDGTKSVKRDNDNWVNYTYSGPKEMLMHFPVFRIDFSDLSHHDSVTLEPVRYRPNENLTGYSPSSYTTDLLGYMNYVFVVASKLKSSPNKIMDLIAEVQNTFFPLITLPEGLTPLEILQRKFLIMQQKQETEKKLAGVNYTPKAVILFDAPNNSSILIDNSVDTKHKDNEVEVTKGFIKIKVIHDPIKD